MVQIHTMREVEVDQEKTASFQRCIDTQDEKNLVVSVIVAWSKWATVDNTEQSDASNCKD
jgi:hypothetical protein